MHLDYSHQLQLKKENVVHAFQKFTSKEYLTINACIPSPLTLHYRNKIQLPAGLENGECILGLYAHHTHDLIPIDHCLVHCELGEKLFQRTREFLRQFQMVAFDVSSQTGELRYVLIKTAQQTKEALVIFVTRTSSTEKWQQLAHLMMQECPEIKGILLNINDSPSNTVLGAHQMLLEGRDYIEEKLCGLRFRFSPKAFFQVNPYQAAQLYTHVLENAGLTGAETVLDAYCGVGTLSLLLAQKAKQVVGVEIIPEAIEDAKQNALLNAISNIQFLCAAIEDILSSLPSFDLVVLNPPRKGCDPRLLEALCQKKQKKILYISCDPATLARDASYLLKENYSLKLVQPFDMFPQTMHVETLAVFVPF
jgi:23S rRNA (uracil1939-C5)-methyltransferase